VISVSYVYLSFELLDFWHQLIQTIQQVTTELTNYRHVVCLLQQRAQALFGILLYIIYGWAGLLTLAG